MHELPYTVVQTRQITRVLVPKGEDLIIVPVYSYYPAPDRNRAADRCFGFPIFIGLTSAQARDRRAIGKVIAEKYAGMISLESEPEWDQLIKNSSARASMGQDDDESITDGVADNVDELSISKHSGHSSNPGSPVAKTASLHKEDKKEKTSRHGFHRRHRHEQEEGPPQLSDMFELAFYGSRRSDEGLANDTDRVRRETVSERRQPKPGVMHRMRHAFDRLAGSAPASEDDEEKEKVPQQLVFASDVIAVEWKSYEDVNKFFGHQHLGRYGDNANYLTHVDAAIESEKRKTAKRLEKGVTLEDCLDEFEREETLGENDLWYCSNCKKHQAATKRMEIYHVPDILVICFKRFGSSGSYYRSKIDQNVDFPIEGLNLEDRCDERRLAKTLELNGAELGPLGLENATKPLVYDLCKLDSI